MSHFCVLVVGANPEAQLRPFHEFECTGEDDQYVQDIDITNEIREREQEEFEEDNNLTVAEITHKALEYYGLDDKIVGDESEVSRSEDHKYGYAVVVDGKLVKAVRRTNPNKKWDWYQLGGRWQGYFRLKPGATGQQGTTGLMTEAAPDGFVDQCLKRDVDIETMRNEAALEARGQHRRFYEITRGMAEIVAWKDVLALHVDLDKSREAYWSQPALKALQQKDEFRHMVAFGEITEFYTTEDEYAARAALRVLVPFAVLKDGKWYERGEMGWFGAVSDEKDPDQWQREFQTLFDSLPDDTLLSLYDCHI